MLDALRQRARTIKRDTYALYLASRDPRTPWYVKLIAGLLVAYALSPIDLIPDFVPVLGYVDDLIIVPAGLLLIARLLPAEVLADARRQAQTEMDRPSYRWAALTVIAIWLLIAVVIGYVVVDQLDLI